MGSTIRVALAEDSLLMREGIRAVLSLEDDVEVIDEFTTADDLLAAMPTLRPDAVVTDIRMPPTHTDEGIRAANRIRADHPSTGVVVLSQYVEPEYAIHLFAHGSQGRGYLLKERVADPGELHSAIRTVVDGGSVMDPQVVDALMADRAPAPTLLDRLTDREREVLAQMAAGSSNGAIGETLFISARSVEKHIASVFTKLDLPPDDTTNRRVRAVLVHLGLDATTEAVE